MASWARRLLDWWTDPTPGRMNSWLMHKAPDLLLLGGAVLCGTFGIGLLVTNPAGVSTGADTAYGSDAPLQPWVAVIGGGFLIVAAMCLLGSACALWVRLTKGFESFDDQEPRAEDGDASDNPVPPEE